jgi:SAM-dependent methyltransferase
MILEIKKQCRRWARSHLLTFNTIRYRVEFPRILDAFKRIGKQERVFDGGAGGGQMLRQVYEAGYCASGVGLEYDPNLYQILVSNFADISALTCQRGSLTEVPHPDESFDCAMTTQVLEHIEDHEKAASELARIVKKGGHLIVSVPHPPEPFPNVGHVREGYYQKDLDALFPVPHFVRISTGYSLTQPTLKRAMFSEKLPFHGCFMPVAWADCETHLSDDERFAQGSYAITCLYQKR